MGRLGRRPIVDVEHRAHQAIVDDQVEELDRQALERGLPLRRLPPETTRGLMRQLDLDERSQNSRDLKCDILRHTRRSPRPVNELLGLKCKNLIPFSVLCVFALF